jgi:FG-GAP-like repeat
VAGTGDFNGDGRVDILWRSTSTGQIADWLGTLTGGFTGNAGNSRNSVSTDWHVAGVGDFNGDGRSDILWMNDSGRVVDWLGTATGGFTGNGAHSSSTVAAGWQVAGTGDFNGDGIDDVLWYNSSLGRIADWLGNNSGGFTGNGANSTNVLGAGWHVAGIGDFNRDGYSDILLRNSTTGQVTDWLGTVRGGFVDNTAHSSATLSTDWQVTGVGDYNGDAIDDILWRNTVTGQVTEWLGNLNGGFVDNSGHASSTVATSWHVEPVAHLL